VLKPQCLNKQGSRSDQYGEKRNPHLASLGFDLTQQCLMSLLLTLACGRGRSSVVAVLLPCPPRFRSLIIHQMHPEVLFAIGQFIECVLVHVVV